MTTILVVDDEPGMRKLLKRSLKKKFDTILEAASVSKAMALLEKHPDLDVVLTDVALPDGEGFEIVDQASEMTSNPAVLVMTGLQSIDNPINALRHNAADFLLKPFSLDALDQSITRALERRETTTASGQHRILNQDDDAAEWRAEFAPDVVGEHPSLLRVFSIIERVADTDCSVLVTGESGTGKEAVARSLHRASDRANAPLVVVNCAAIPENLLESELFGHVRGTPAIIGLLCHPDRTNRLCSCLTLTEANLNLTQFGYDLFGFGSLAHVPTPYLKPELTQTSGHVLGGSPVHRSTYGPTMARSLLLLR